MGHQRRTQPRSSEGLQERHRSVGWAGVGLGTKPPGRKKLNLDMGAGTASRPESSGFQRRAQQKPQRREGEEREVSSGEGRRGGVAREPRKVYKVLVEI